MDSNHESPAKCVLLVEDNDVIRDVLEELLWAAGYHIILTASNGLEAWPLMQGNQVDLLLTNVLMPVRDGLEVIRKFRERFPRAKVLALSGGGSTVGNDVCLRLAKRLGADEVLAKPFLFDELLEVVERLTARASAEDVDAFYQSETAQDCATVARHGRHPRRLLFERGEWLLRRRHQLVKFLSRV